MTTQICFSPSGTSRRIGAACAHALDAAARSFDLLADADIPTQYTADDLLVVSMPVFAGRIPAACVPRLQRLRGAGTPAVAVAVYGNRAYEDALLELCDLLQAQGFAVLGAGAFVAQHSMFPAVAAGRPDDADLRQVAAFAAACGQKWRQGDWQMHTTVPGNRPYRPPASGPRPFTPVADERCTGCGVCARRCPVQAIPAAKPWRTDAARCIGCTACIHRCPAQARRLSGETLAAFTAAFVRDNAVRQQPVWFL